MYQENTRAQPLLFHIHAHTQIKKKKQRQPKQFNAIYMRWLFTQEGLWHCVGEHQVQTVDTLSSACRAKCCHCIKVTHILPIIDLQCFTDIYLTSKQTPKTNADKSNQCPNCPYHIQTGLWMCVSHFITKRSVKLSFTLTLKAKTAVLSWAFQAHDIWQPISRTTYCSMSVLSPTVIYKH